MKIFTVASLIETDFSFLNLIMVNWALLRKGNK